MTEKQYNLNGIMFEYENVTGRYYGWFDKGTEGISLTEDQLIALKAQPIQPDESECNPDWTGMHSPNCKCHQPHPSEVNRLSPEERKEAVRKCVEIIKRNNKSSEIKEIEKLNIEYPEEINKLVLAEKINKIIESIDIINQQLRRERE